MTFLLWIIVGIAIGFSAYLLDNQDAKGGLVGAIIFGILGSFLGGVTATIFFGATGKELSTLLIVFSSSLFFLLIQRTILSQSERF